MVLIDTTVWVTLYRKQSALIGQRLWQLAATNEAAICGQVWVEFIGGFRNERKRNEQSAYLRSFRWLETTRDAFELAGQWLALYPALGAGDAIIAATAVATGASLLTLDRGFLNLQSEGLVVEMF